MKIMEDIDAILYIIYEGEFRDGKKWNGKIKEYFKEFDI